MARTVTVRMLTVLVFVLGGAAACVSPGGSRTGTGGDPFSGGSSRSPEASGGREITVQVVNSNFNQATISARGPGSNRRLGRVSGNDEGRFTLPWAGADGLYFEVELLGGGGCTTRRVQVAGGQTIRLVITGSRGSVTWSEVGRGAPGGAGEGRSVRLRQDSPDWRAPWTWSNTAG